MSLSSLTTDSRRQPKVVVLVRCPGCSRQHTLRLDDFYAMPTHYPAHMGGAWPQSLRTCAPHQTLYLGANTVITHCGGHDLWVWLKGRAPFVSVERLAAVMRPAPLIH